MSLSILKLCVASALFVLGQGGYPIQDCAAPTPPLNGDIFLTGTGAIVKYICNEGFQLKGLAIAICKNGEWDPEPPTCELIEDGTENLIDGFDEERNIQSPLSPRPLFQWDEDDNKNKVNDTMQGDEPRVRMILYPRERATPISHQSVVRPAVEKIRSNKKESLAEATAPDVAYVRRALGTGKSWPYYYSAALHAMDGRYLSNEDAQRYYYHYYASQYPRSALLDYRTVLPYGSTLSESQIAWINSLAPELRDRYLKDMQAMGVQGLNYLSYTDGYHWVSGDPYYVRQPLAVAENHPDAIFDYSCHRTDRSGYTIKIDAPHLRNAKDPVYHKKYNPHFPYNVYLSAEYECKPGYKLLDSRFRELYCSRGTWIGRNPVCVR